MNFNRWTFLTIFAALFAFSTAVQRLVNRAILGLVGSGYTLGNVGLTLVGAAQNAWNSGAAQTIRRRLGAYLRFSGVMGGIGLIGLLIAVCVSPFSQTTAKVIAGISGLVGIIIMFAAIQLVNSLAGAAGAILWNAIHRAVHGILYPFIVLGAIMATIGIAIMIRPEWIVTPLGIGVSFFLLIIWALDMANSRFMGKKVIYIMVGIALVFLAIGSWDVYYADMMSKPGMALLRQSETDLEQAEREAKAAENAIAIDGLTGSEAKKLQAARQKLQQQQLRVAEAETLLKTTELANNANRINSTLEPLALVWSARQVISLNGEEIAVFDANGAKTGNLLNDGDVVMVNFDDKITANGISLVKVVHDIDGGSKREGYVYVTNIGQRVEIESLSPDGATSSAAGESFISMTLMSPAPGESWIVANNTGRTLTAKWGMWDYQINPGQNTFTFYGNNPGTNFVINIKQKEERKVRARKQ